MTTITLILTGYLAIGFLCAGIMFIFVHFESKNNPEEAAKAINEVAKVSKNPYLALLLTTALFWPYFVYMEVVRR